VVLVVVLIVTIMKIFAINKTTHAFNTPLTSGCIQSFSPTSISIATCATPLPDSQYWTYTDSQTIALGSSQQQCLSVPSASVRTNVWGKKLQAAGTWAVVFINVEPTIQNVTCDSACFAAMGYSGGVKVNVRDLWAHTNLSAIVTDSPWTMNNVPANGGHFMFLLSPY